HVGRNRPGGPREAPPSSRARGRGSSDRRRVREEEQPIQVDLGPESGGCEGRGTSRRGEGPPPRPPTPAAAQGIPGDQARLPRRRGPGVPRECDQRAPPP